MQSCLRLWLWRELDELCLWNNYLYLEHREVIRKMMPAREARHMEHCHSTLQSRVHGDCHNQYTRGLSQPIVQGDDHNHVYTGIVTNKCTRDCHNQCTEGFVDVLVKLRCSTNNHRHFKPCIITSRFSSQMFMCKFTNVRWNWRSRKEKWLTETVG